MLRTEEIGDSYIMNYRYDLNGTLAENSVGALNAIRYRGYVYDSETGLYYLQSRYYDPEIGRFLNTDSVDYIGINDTVLSYNAFVYCENNVVNYNDYFGLAKLIGGCKMICNRKCFILVVSALVLLFTSFACISFSKTLYTNMQYSQIEVIFNCCNAHEKKGEDFVENSDHDIESGIYDANGIYSDFYVEGYKHIHCLVPKTYGGYYCAAIGNNGLKYLLSLNVKMKVVSFVEVSNLPAKMFANNDSLIAYYISDGAASLYKIDFENSEIGILVDDISIANSGNAKLIGSIYKDTEEYFNLYEYEYQRYLESGEDLLYTLFDEKCFESVYVQNNSIVYRTNKSDEVPKWIVKDNLGECAFFNEDRCFGFIGERTLLFYRCIHLGLFDIGMFYKYDYAQGRKFDNRIVFNRGIIQGEISDNKEKFYFSSSVTEGVIFYCMDLKTGIYNEVLDDVEYRGRFCVLNKT